MVRGSFMSGSQPLGGDLPPSPHREGRCDQPSDQVSPGPGPTPTGVYPDVPVECVALPGPATGLLLEVSAGAGLLVVGARGGAGLPSMLRSPTAQVLTRRARCSVVITR